MDPLSGVLSLLKPRDSMFRTFEIGGDWSIQFPRHEGIKCYAVVDGECWLSVEGVAEPAHLKSGDCFLLPLGRPFRLASDLALTPVDFEVMLSIRADGRVAWPAGRPEVSGVGGFFGLERQHADLLLGVLPAIVHIRRESDRSALRWSMERMIQELRDPQPGGVLVVQQLAHLLLVQALRAHLAEGSGGGVGWLYALADRPMRDAIHAIHEDPAHPWTLRELAGRVGMSRSGFARRFKETVGASPIDYLTRWRMFLAGDRLANSDDPVSVVSLALGYDSESAFRTAFKRVMGCTPRRYVVAR